jgi:glycosyltransferase involved in cell wall biosynthesis
MRLPPSGAEIELVARLPHNEVMTRLAEACIAVLPNRPDPDSAFTSPIKLFEYMAAGCAVVAADLPSIREILGNDEAIWFTSGDAKSLAVALQNIATNNHAEALGAVLREKSRAYTWQARAEKIKEFIFSSLG